ncbi:hypothetical protein BP6252_12548 [Coleophoma cylindrospora]|uniref:Uncharacterized protein n=1 Tax=Coleophoma cylindrospora TaxID=1849047 RepID=A0A3D8QCJ3_9HELO|nr:hypothetical protein BP6252_12548 [Coleophoma cylindrospora]
MATVMINGLAVVAMDGQTSQVTRCWHRSIGSFGEHLWIIVVVVLAASPPKAKAARRRPTPPHTREPRQPTTALDGFPSSVAALGHAAAPAHAIRRRATTRRGRVVPYSGPDCGAARTLADAATASSPANADVSMDMIEGERASSAPLGMTNVQHEIRAGVMLRVPLLA